MAACTLHSGGLSFDLSELAFLRAPAAPPGHGHFLVSLCGPPPDPSAGDAFAGCAAPVAVAQMMNACFRLGTSAAAALNTAAFSAAPSAPGFSITHSDGDRCAEFGNGQGGLPRRVRVDVACSAVTEASAFEDETCSYVVTVRSPAACPLQCPRGARGGAVCGGSAHGECVLNAGGGAECACALGYAGAACEEASAAAATVPHPPVAGLPEPSPLLGARRGDAALLIARAGLASVVCIFLWAARGHSIGFAAALALAFLALAQPQPAPLLLPALAPRLREVDDVHPDAWAGFAMGEWVGEAGREVWVSARHPAAEGGAAAAAAALRPVRILLLGDSIDRYLVADGCAGLGASEPWDWSDGLFPYRHGMSGAGMCSTPDGSATLASLHLFGAAPAGPYLHNHGGELDDTAPRISRGLEQFRNKAGQGPTHIVYHSNSWDALLHLRERSGVALLRAFVADVNATLARLRELEPDAKLLVRTTPSNMPLKAMYNEGLRIAAARQGVPLLDWNAQVAPLLLHYEPFYRDNGMHPSVHYSRAFALQLVQWAALQHGGA